MDLENIDHETRSAWLISAAYHCDDESVRDLLAGGASPFACDKNGFTALHWCAFRAMCSPDDSLRVAEMLVDAGADLNAHNGPGDTVLMWAVASGHLEVVRLLLRRGADPNIRALNGVTPLMWAAQQSSKEVINLLLEAGADPDAVECGFRASDYAYRSGREEEIIQLLGGTPD